MATKRRNPAKYQVDSKRMVKDLSLEEAHQEICRQMDLIEKLRELMWKEETLFREFGWEN